MNFLAHIYLSGNNKSLTIGNFIADHVKGKSVFSLPAQIIQGVQLHRKIDQFTDIHPVVAQTKKRLRPKFRKFSPVVADMYFDHFLAADWSRYSPVELKEFSENFYAMTDEFIHVLPERTKRLLPYMKLNNWLLNYASLEGIHKALSGMAKRTAFNSGMEKATEELEQNYSQYQSEFYAFFEDVEQFAGKEIQILDLK